MKKNLTSLLSLFFLFVSSLFVSCFNNNNLAEPAGGSIEFYIPGSVFQRSAGVMKAENDLNALTVQVDLVSDAGRNTKTAALSNEGTSISFENLLVGLSVYAEAKILYGDLVVAQGTSDPIIIQTGSNPIKVTMKYLFNGVLEIGLEKNITLVKNTQASSAEIWLNKGEFAFSLLDDEGNDILSDVDWTYKKTAEGGAVGADGTGTYEEEVNQDLLLVQARLKKNHREINFVPRISYNKVLFSGNFSDALPGEGSYELTLIVGPNKKTYVNNEGKEELFPQFEPVSETFTIQVINAYDFDMNYYFSEDDFSAAFRNITQNYLTGDQRKVSFSGTTSLSYYVICANIKSVINDEAPLYDFDMGELRSSGSEEDRNFGSGSGGVFDGCERISSFVLPGDAISILNQAFLNCTALTSVTIPASVEKIDMDVFCGCSALSNVEIPIDGELKIIYQNAFTGTALTSFTVPKKVVAIEKDSFSSSCNVTLADTSGTWYGAGEEFSTGDSLWNDWIVWVDGDPENPDDLNKPKAPQRGDWVDTPVTTLNVEDFSEFIHGYYYLYCVK